METCSWCTTEVPNATLQQQPDGARICRECQATVAYAEILSAVGR